MTAETLQLQQEHEASPEFKNIQEFGSKTRPFDLENDRSM